jgi:APA family basic amino acid/polyamine antiporter
VALGVLVLRRKQPERRRAFRTPWVPVVPVAAIACCVILMASLPLETWLRFLVWLVIGLVIYFAYSRHHSEFGRAPHASAIAAPVAVEDSH